MKKCDFCGNTHDVRIGGIYKGVAMCGYCESMENASLVNEGR